MTRRERDPRPGDEVLRLDHEQVEGGLGPDLGDVVPRPDQVRRREAGERLGDQQGGSRPRGDDAAGPEARLPAGRAQGVEELHLREEEEGQGRDAEGAEAGVRHDLQHLRPGPAASQAVGAVRQPVLVEAAGDVQAASDGQGRRRGDGEADRRDHAVQRDRDRPSQDGPDDREVAHAAHQEAGMQVDPGRAGKARDERPDREEGAVLRSKAERAAVAVGSGDERPNFGGDEGFLAVGSGIISRFHDARREDGGAAFAIVFCCYYCCCC